MMISMKNWSLVMIKLQEGKKYLDRDGTVVEVQPSWNLHGAYPWERKRSLSSIPRFRTYTKEGLVIVGKTSRSDLVKEYIEESKSNPAEEIIMSVPALCISFHEPALELLLIRAYEEGYADGSEGAAVDWHNSDTRADLPDLFVPEEADK